MLEMPQGKNSIRYKCSTMSMKKSIFLNHFFLLLIVFVSCYILNLIFMILLKDGTTSFSFTISSVFYDLNPANLYLIGNFFFQNFFEK